MLLGVVARAFRRIAAAAGFEFQTGLGSPTATVAYQGQPESVDVVTGLGSPFGAQGYQAGSDAYAFDTALGSPTAITGKSGSAEAFAIVTGMGSPTATVAYQGGAAAIEVVTEFPSIVTEFAYTNTEAQTFEDNADTTGWDDALRDDIDQLFSDLKSGQVNSTNTLAELDFLYLHDLPNSADSLRCLISPASRTATAVNSPTHAANEGFTGDGSSAYIDLNFTPSTDGVNWTRNDAHLGVWVRTTDTSGNTRIYVGSASGSGENTNIYNSSSPTGWTAAGPNGGFIEGTTAKASATGLLGANRSASSANQIYRNGASEGSDTDASTPTASDALYALAYNNGGSPGLYTAGQISASMGGGSLTANQWADLYDALNRYRTAREAV